MNRVEKILELQAKARMLIGEAQELLNEADKLRKEAVPGLGRKFIYNGDLYEFNHKATYPGGNTDWLEISTSIPIIK